MMWKREWVGGYWLQSLQQLQLLSVHTGTLSMTGDFCITKVAKEVEKPLAERQTRHLSQKCLLYSHAIGKELKKRVVTEGVLQPSITATSHCIVFQPLISKTAMD